MFVRLALTLCCLWATVTPATAAAMNKGGGAPLPLRHGYTNVILISLDILRADHLGAYGYRRATSPNIDRLAKQSVLFEQAVAQSYLTPVAQYSVFTGMYPRMHGMVSFGVGKDEVEEHTLQHILRLYGYETAAAVSSPEFFMRFDTEAGKTIDPRDIFTHDFGYFGRNLPDESGSVRGNPLAALDWLKANKEKKFFLWIESGLLHPPYSQTVPLPYRTRFDPPGYTPFYEKLPIRPAAPREDSGVPTEVLFHLYRGNYYLDFKPVHKLTAEDVAFIRGRYDAGVYYTDTFIGDLLALLDELKLTDKTLVVFHSIHGEGLGEHGYFFHHDVFDTEVKTALMFRLPGGARAGTRIGRQVQGIDIMPTILDYLQIPLDQEAQGVSLLPLIDGNPARYRGSDYAFIDRLPWWEYVLEGWHLEHQGERDSQYTPAENERMKDYRARLTATIGGDRFPPECIAVRTKEWKLILHQRHRLLEEVSWWNFISGTTFPVAEVELYDLRHDPLEQVNVADRHPQVVAKLKKKLLAWDRANSHRQQKVYTKPTTIIPYP